MKFNIILALILLTPQVFGSYIFPGQSVSGGGSGNILSINSDTTDAQIIAGSNNISVSTSLGTTTINGILLAPKASPTFTGTVTTPVTASRALVTGASSELAVSATTATELGYVNGVTSSIQTQMNLKAPLASPTFTGTVTTPVTASRALVTGASSELAVSATTATELGYVNGVTSAIQTQLNAKQGLDAQLTSVAGLAFSSNALKVVRVNAGETDFELATITAGDFSGPGSSTDNAIVRFDGTGGKTGQNSNMTLSDRGEINVTQTGTVTTDVIGLNVVDNVGGNTSAAFYTDGSGGNWIIRGTGYSAAASSTTGSGHGGGSFLVRSANWMAGVVGIATGADGTSPRLFGVEGSASYVSGHSTAVGGYFELAAGSAYTYTIPSGVIAALVATNKTTDQDIVNFMDNATSVFKIADGGIVTIGTGTSTRHILNSLTANVSNCGTLATACIDITINGVTHYIPYW